MTYTDECKIYFHHHVFLIRPVWNIFATYTRNISSFFKSCIFLVSCVCCLVPITFWSKRTIQKMSCIWRCLDTGQHGMAYGQQSPLHVHLIYVCHLSLLYRYFFPYHRHLHVCFGISACFCFGAIIQIRQYRISCTTELFTFMKSHSISPVLYIYFPQRVIPPFYILLQAISSPVVFFNRQEPLLTAWTHPRCFDFLKADFHDTMWQ